MNGLKRVANRRNDALTRVGWDELETMLAAYYRSEGFDVEHVGTGATGAGSDGGIDLKLRRDAQFVIVQCKHWNALKVPHNAVHELLGLMVNHGATGAILANSGEFTKAAIEAAQKLGHVQLIDGDELRAMLGPIREPAPAFDSVRMGAADGAPAAVARRIGERLLSATEDRIRYGGRERRRRGSKSRDLVTVLAIKLVAFVLFIAFILLMYQFVLKTSLSALSQVAHPTAVAPAAPAPVRPAPTAAATPTHQTADHDRSQQQRADEAAGVIAESTPEL